MRVFAWGLSIGEHREWSRKSREWFCKAINIIREWFLKKIMMIREWFWSSGHATLAPKRYGRRPAVATQTERVGDPGRDPDGNVSGLREWFSWVVFLFRFFCEWFAWVVLASCVFLVFFVVSGSRLIVFLVFFCELFVWVVSRVLRGTGRDPKRERENANGKTLTGRH